MQPSAPIRNGKCIEGQRRVQYLDVLRHDNDNDGGIPKEYTLVVGFHEYEPHEMRNLRRGMKAKE